MAVEKIVNVTINDNAADVEKDINKLNRAGENLESTFKDVNHTFEDVYGELQPLTTRLGEAEDRMYELALAGKQNTEEYRELLKATANYRQVQIQTDLVVDTAAQTLSGKMVGALEGVASGFALVQGTMGLFTTENEELEKALLKVQSAMALAQGIQGVRTALPLFTTLGNTIKTKVVTAFTSLKGAIAATGIGALVVAIGGLIYAMDEYNSTLEETIENEEKLREIQSKNAKELDETAKKREEERNRRKGGLNDLKRELELLEAQGVAEDKLFKLRKDILDKELFNLEVRRDTFIKNNAEEKAIRDNAIEQIKNKQNEIAILDAKYAESSKKTITGVTTFTTEVKEETDNTLDELNRKRFQDEAEEKSRLLLEIERLENEYLDSQLSLQDREINSVRDKYTTLLELAEQYKLDTTTLEEARESELATIRNKYKEEDVDTTQEVEDDKTAIKLQAASNVLNILSLLSNIGDQESKKTFQLQKAVGLAQATIDTYKGAASAYANTVGGPVIKGIAAGVAVAAGLANVKKIASTQFSPSSTSTPSITSPTISSPSTQQLSSPNFNVVGATGISQTEELQPVKAYVVSGDVTTAQSLDRNRIQNATF
jgi:chromosome segregation ATPase